MVQYFRQLWVMLPINSWKIRKSLSSIEEDLGQEGEKKQLKLLISIFVISCLRNTEKNIVKP